MFEQSFTLTIQTDAQGRFHSSQRIASPFSLDVKISATLQSPPAVAVLASFSLSNSESTAVQPLQFSVSTGETIDLGKWRAIAGDDANLATAEGYTEPAAPHAAVTVLFIAAPSFF